MWRMYDVHQGTFQASRTGSMQIKKGQRGKDRKSWREGEGVYVSVCVGGGEGGVDATVSCCWTAEG